MQEYNKMKDPMKSSKYTQVWYDLDVRTDESHFARLEDSASSKRSNPSMMTDVSMYTQKLGRAPFHD